MGAGLGISGVSPSLAARPQFPLQFGATKASPQGSEVFRRSFPNKALGHLDPLRVLYKMGGRQVPPGT